MTAMLVLFTAEEQPSVVRFLWAKGLNVKNIIKEMFPVYGRKCLSLKAVPP
jgi:Iap family predicted aminopeptidase